MDSLRKHRLLVILALIIGLNGTHWHSITLAEGEDPAALYQMVQNGQVEEAVQIVVAAGYERGGWGPAPGDVVVFDANLPPEIGGQVNIIDLPFLECIDAKPPWVPADCQRDFTYQQNQVRLGYGLFAPPHADGNPGPWSTFDDLLSVYIEEVGHSWQEYLYETGGLGSGPRTRQTRSEDGNYRFTGWEYQIKRYILSLDGSWLALSAEQHNRLRADMCTEGGYANPVGRRMDAYGPPSGWPNPAGWPTSVPTAGEWAAFCAA